MTVLDMGKKLFDDSSLVDNGNMFRDYTHYGNWTLGIYSTWDAVDLTHRFPESSMAMHLTTCLFPFSMVAPPKSAHHQSLPCRSELLQATCIVLYISLKSRTETVPPDKIVANYRFSSDIPP